MLENTIYDSKLRRRRSRKMTIWEGAQGPDPVPNPPWGWGGWSADLMLLSILSRYFKLLSPMENHYTINIICGILEFARV